MASKTSIVRLCAVSLLLVGCATLREKPLPAKREARASSPAPAAGSAPATASQQAPVRVPARKSPPAPAQSARSDLASSIGNGATWLVPGQTVAVNRGTAPTQPVPLFRQAGVLASVRAALAGSPTQPQAEFRHGVLTLTFKGGNNDEIASAVNRAMSVPEARKLQVTLQP